MSDYISREAIAKRIEEMEIVGPLYYGIPVVEALEAIREAPAADARPIRRAEWLERRDPNGDTYYVCTNCGAEFVMLEGTPLDNDYCYCPRCAATMLGIRSVQEMEEGEDV